MKMVETKKGLLIAGLIFVFLFLLNSYIDNQYFLAIGGKFSKNPRLVWIESHVIVCCVTVAFLSALFFFNRTKIIKWYNKSKLKDFVKEL